MDGSQKIEQLKKEVEHLSEQVSVNHQRLEKLEQQLRRLMEEKTITTDASSQKLLKQTPTNENLNFENFIGLRLIHLVGIVVLVIGLSIGVKYAIDRELVSEVTRIVSAYGAGFLLYFFSWRLKKNYNLFSAILFSGAMASIYFTTYAAFVYYGMLSFAVAFVIMIALTLFTVYKALEYKRQEIAILGLVGAYTIPFLISTNADRADLLFAYIGLINIGVVFLAFKKSWNLVGQLAQAVTWILFLGWIGTRYNVQDQKIAFVFMIFFFYCLQQML